MPSHAETSDRDLFRASLELLVLSVLVDGPAHGYLLQQRVHHATGQPLPAGTLYPLIQRFESAGWVTGEEQTVRGRSRKSYHLTAEGRQRLRRGAAHWQATIARLQAVVLPALRRTAERRRV